MEYTLWWSNMASWDIPNQNWWRFTSGSFIDEDVPLPFKRVAMGQLKKKTKSQNMEWTIE